jgi:chromosome segregation ATPase
MGFLKKFKKLKFWKKHEERAKKRDRSIEVVETNFEFKSINLDVEPNFEGKRRNKDLEPNLPECSEELSKKLEEKVAHQKQLEATISDLEEKIICKDQVEASLRACVNELQKKLEESDSERHRVEAMLRGRVSELEEKLDKKESELCDCKAVEETLQDRVTQHKKTISKVDRMASKLRDRVNELEENLKERVCEKEQAVAMLYGRVNEFQKKVDELQHKLEDADCESSRVEAIFRRRVSELEEKLEEKGSELSEYNKVEEVLRGQVKQLKKTISEMDSNRGKVEDTRKQTHVCEVDEETLRRQFEDLQDEDDLEAATGPFGDTGNIFDHALHSVEICCFVLILSIILGHINAFISCFY